MDCKVPRQQAPPPPLSRRQSHRALGPFSSRSPPPGLAPHARWAGDACYFLHRHLDFRRAEVQALADLAGSGAEHASAPHGDVEHSPLWHVWLPSDAAAREICERSVLVKAFVELWGEGDGPDALCASIASYPAARKDPFLAPDTTFKVELEDFGWTEHGTRGDNWAPVVRRMDALAPAVTFLGKARMKDPQHVFWSVETAREGQWKGLPSDIPPRNYFGRVVAKGLGRACMKTYDLTKRRYLGPTSMDVEMGLIMCNMAHARPGGVVWDPFCGTGSILIAAAHFGAMTLGSDIDIRVIKHGKRDKKTGKQVDVWTNFEDYGLPPPVGLVRMDLHKHSFKRDPAAEATTGEHTSSGDVGGSSSGLARGPSVARLEGSLQAVVGDPPYGVRAGVGSPGVGNASRTAPSRRFRGAPLGPHPEHGAVSLLGVPRRPHGPEREAPRGGRAAVLLRARGGGARRTRPPPARTRSRATRAWS